MTRLTVEMTDSNASRIEFLLETGLVQDSWKATNPPTDLVRETGSVSDKDSKLSCVSDGNEVVAFVGATWNSSKGEEGDAICTLCTNCSPDQRWKIVSRED